MARKKKASSGGGAEEVPAWMITFSDLTTLLPVGIFCLAGVHGVDDGYIETQGCPGFRFRQVRHGRAVPGRFVHHARQEHWIGSINMFKDLQPMKKRVWEDPNSDLRFEYNKFIQRLSIDADVLFGPGSAELTSKGRQLLDSVRPSIQESAYPLGLSGHTAGGRDEFGPEYLAPAGQTVDFSWRLSLDRVLSVYRYFVDSGVPADKLRVEAFGRYRPKAGDSTPADRKASRRGGYPPWISGLAVGHRQWLPEFRTPGKRARRKIPRRSVCAIIFFRFDLPE